MLIHTFKTSYLAGRDKRIMTQGQLVQKHDTLFEKQTKLKKNWKHGSSSGTLA
jgi:hypothetical protein